MTIKPQIVAYGYQPQCGAAVGTKRFQPMLLFVHHSLVCPHILCAYYAHAAALRVFFVFSVCLGVCRVLSLAAVALAAGANLHSAGHAQVP